MKLRAGSACSMSSETQTIRQQASGIGRKEFKIKALLESE